MDAGASAGRIRASRALDGALARVVRAHEPSAWASPAPTRSQVWLRRRAATRAWCAVCQASAHTWRRPPAVSALCAAVYVSDNRHTSQRKGRTQRGAVNTVKEQPPRRHLLGPRRAASGVRVEPLRRASEGLREAHAGVTSRCVVRAGAFVEFARRRPRVRAASRPPSPRRRPEPHRLLRPHPSRRSGRRS